MLTSKRGRRRLWLVLAGLFGVGCSFLSDFSVDQCQTDADCEKLGSAFEGTVCDANLCVTPESGDGDGDGDGSGGSIGGQGGAPLTAECETNSDCIDDNFGSPFICRDGECIALTIPGECPIVLGAGQDSENLRKPEPFIFGAYSYVDPTAPRLSVPTLNYELAIQEVNDATRGGIPGGPNGTRRPFIAIVCSGTQDPDLETSLSHLIDDVQVPAIISSLYTRDLLEAFQTKGFPEKVFFLSPLEADSTLTSVDDDGLMWHLLSPAVDFAPAYLPLVAQTESYVRTQRGLTEDDKIKIALVESKTPFLTDIADNLLLNMSFNGGISALQNREDGNLIRIRLDSSLEVVNPNTGDNNLQGLSALIDFEPDIVLGLVSGEFVELMNSFEGQVAGEKPFYVLSPYVFGRSDLADQNFFDDVHPRLLGVNFGAAEDPTLYQLYLSKLEDTYRDVGFSLAGSENFYDAAYYLMYAIVGAGEPPRLTGNEIALGMTRLVNGRVEFNVGSMDANDVVGTLRGSISSEISLIGTMGPPDFNTSTGARRGRPTIYCIDGNGDYVQNAMLYDVETGTLSGSPPCVADFAN